MADILSPTGIEKPVGGELHSRAQYLRNLDRINQVAIDLANNVLEDKKVRHAELTGPAIGYPNSAANWGVGTLTADAGMSKNNSFVIPGSADQVKMLETGLFMFQWLMASTGVVGNGEMVIKNNTSGVQIGTGDTYRIVTWGPMMNCVAYCNADDLINFYTVNRQAGWTASSRIKVSKLQG